MIMIDTDIIIWILRGHPEIKQQFDNVVVEVHGEVYVTPIQIVEIYAGLRESERTQTEEFFEALPKILIDDEMGKQAGEFVRKYRKSHNVTLSDALIAAASKLRHLKLWTLNTKHYPMFSKEQFLEL